MPRGCCTERWVLEHPNALISLQQSYARSGSQIIYAPTFQAQPIALERQGLEANTEEINARLVQLSKQACPQCLVAGNLTTLATFTDSFDEENFDLLVENYRRQIRGLLEGGADLLAAETLMYPLEAEAILTAAELEQAGAVCYSFTMQSDGALFSGREAGPILKELEEAGAAAVGFNCVAADRMTPGLVSRLRRYVKGPLMCKPNAGVPVIGEDQLAHYPMEPEEFAAIMADCVQLGATLLGGCCGTDPRFIAALKEKLR
jgi:5-methyltetrahydrofolate--homocysteine methyltransferase